ncbi:hypothetical protein PRNP1_003518 [Phytophthora ramorum]
MASYDRPEDADLLMDDFLFQESDAFALPLLDFDPDGALLTPTELAMAQTQLPDSHSASYQPSSPVSTDDGSTDAEVSTPPPTSAQQQEQQTLLYPSDAASSPAARMSLLGSSASMHSPLPSDQKLLAPRSSNSHDSGSNRNGNHAGTSMTSAANAGRPVQPSKMLPIQTPTLFPGTLPYAMPVAYFPPALNATQKRPCPQVFPGAASPEAGPVPAAASDNDPNASKSKREIRQMKNRESANKSRLRRKAQLTTLTTEVTELKQKEQELQTIIAGLRAENKSLLDQNTFLRSLVTSSKQEPSSSLSNHQMAAFASLPPPMEQNCLALNMLESGQKMDVDSDAQTADVDLTAVRPGKRRAVTSTLSTASLAVCASVFGITVFTDYDGGAVDSGNIRGVGRVLHEAPTACGLEGCSPESSSSMVGLVVTAVRSWWQFVSSSELVFGVLLNVLSFIAIVAVYQLWQTHSAGAWSWKFPVLSTSGCRGVRHQAKSSASGSATRDEKERNAAGRDVRVREKPDIRGN